MLSRLLCFSSHLATSPFTISWRKSRTSICDCDGTVFQLVQTLLFSIVSFQLRPVQSRRAARLRSVKACVSKARGICIDQRLFV